MTKGLRDNIIEEIRQLLKEEYNITDVKLTDNIKKDFGLTSFDFANLVCLLEEKFNIDIDEEKYRSIHTVEDFIDYIDSLNSYKYVI